mgnify:CR=1 FL=1
MADRIRVECEECGKKLACPASAAGRSIKCPACDAAITVRAPISKSRSEPTNELARKPTSKPKSKRKRPSAAASDSSAADNEAFLDDPYGAPSAGASSAGAALPQRRRKRVPSGGKRSAADHSSSGQPHWSRNRLVGTGVILITIVSSGLQVAVQGKPNLRTAAGQGQLAGQLTVLAAGVIAGIVILVRSFGGSRK